MATGNSGHSFNQIDFHKREFHPHLVKGGGFNIIIGIGNHSPRPDSSSALPFFCSCAIFMSVTSSALSFWPRSSSVINWLAVEKMPNTSQVKSANHNNICSPIHRVFESCFFNSVNWWHFCRLCTLFHKHMSTIQCTRHRQGRRYTDVIFDIPNGVKKGLH